MNKTLMLIHGAWLTPRSWDRFSERFTARGAAVVAPAWPLMDRGIEALRCNPAPELRHLGIKRIVDHYEALIRALPEPPILMGHSFGGLFVQLLLDRGLGAAGVAIDAVPPLGVIADPLAIWTSRSVYATWNGWNRVLKMSLDSFSTGFAQTLPEAQKPGAYKDQVVPTPGRIFFEAPLGIGSRVQFASPTRAPLLLIAGEKDRTVPAPMVRANARKQSRARSQTDFQLFVGRSHWLCNEPGWEEVADFALDWALKNSGP